MYYDGLTAIRLLKCKAIGGGDPIAAVSYAETRRDWPDQRDIVSHLKAGVSGQSVSDLDGGSEIAADFLGRLSPLTIAGRSRLRRVPARVPLLTQTGGPTGYWTGESKAVRASAGSYRRDELPWRKTAALVVATKEHLADKSIAGESSLLADMLAACVEAMDRSFIGGAVGDLVTPQSINYNAFTIPSSGTDVSDLDRDIGAAMAALIAAGSNLSNATWATSQALAAKMGMARGASGSLCYPGVTALGGVLCGIPLIASSAVEADSDATSSLTLFDGSQINFADAAPMLRTSDEAMIELDTDPTGASDTPVGASANLVSMFQGDCVALIATLRANWLVRRAGMVAVITGAGLAQAS
jgi:hypothetical protein